MFLTIKHLIHTAGGYAAICHRSTAQQNAFRSPYCSAETAWRHHSGASV